MNKTKIKEKDYSKIIELYKTLGAEEIGQKYNVSRKTITRFLKRLNILVRNRGNIKIPFNEDFFENIDSEEKAYWLGFIMADGCVFNDFLTISLAIKDKKHLEKFKKSIKSNHKITNRTPILFYKNKFKNYPQASFKLKSNKLIYDLAKLGIIPNKTGKEIMPNLNSDLISHLIRGIIDGDGCIYQHHKKYWYINIVSSNKKFLEDIDSVIKMYLNINGKIKGYLNKKTKNKIKNMIYYLDYYKQSSVIELGHFLYKNSSIYLDRKYKKYLQLVENYNEKKISK